MKTVKFIFLLLIQTVVGLISINIFFLVATIKGAINGYPDNAQVKVDIRFGGKDD